MFGIFCINNRNNQGFILVTCLIITALLMLLGISAAMLSYTQSKITKNKRDGLKDFYDTEAAINYAINNSEQWLTEDFIDKEDAKAVFTPPDSSVKLEIRHINNINKIEGLSEAANDLPNQPHVSSPPLDSGFGIRDFETRRYAITATSANGLKIQVGVYKVFSK